MKRLNKGFVFVLSMVLVLSQILTPVMAKSSPRNEAETEAKESNELKIKKVDQFGNPVEGVEFTVEEDEDDDVDDNGDDNGEDDDDEPEDPPADEEPPEPEDEESEQAQADPGRIGLGAPEGSDNETNNDKNDGTDDGTDNKDEQINDKENNQTDGDVGGVKRTFETNEEGLIDLSELEVGKYTISESETPEGYIGLEGSFTLTVGEDDEGNKTYELNTVGLKKDKVKFGEKTNTITVVNEKEVEFKEVVIKKIDSDNQEKTLEGAEFTVEKEEDKKDPETEDLEAEGGDEEPPMEDDEEKFSEVSKFIDLQGDDAENSVSDGEKAHYTTDNSGLVSLGKLEEGTYTITETTAPEGYEELKKNLTLEIKVNESGDLVYTFESENINPNDEKIILEIENKKIKDGEDEDIEGETPGEDGDEEVPGEDGEGEKPSEDGEAETPDEDVENEKENEKEDEKEDDKEDEKEDDKEDDKENDKEDDDKDEIPVENDRPADKDEEKPSKPVVPEDNDEDKDEEKPSKPVVPEDNDEDKDEEKPSKPIVPEDNDEDKDEEKPSKPVVPEDNDENKKEVTIVDKNNKPVKPGQDYVIKDNNGKIVVEGIVDKDGKIVIEKLPAGRYEVEGLEDDYILVVTEDGDYIISIVEHKNPDSVGNVSDDQDYTGDIGEEVGETSVGEVLPRTGQGTNLLVLLLGIILVSLGFYSLKKSY